MPQEVDRILVNKLHRLTRQLDEDPFGDCLWGIITGYTAQDALRVAIIDHEPLEMTRALSTTGIDGRRFSQSYVISDGGPYEHIKESEYGRVSTGMVKVPESAEGMAFLFAKEWEQIDPQLVVSSSHATQYNLEMPFSKGLIASMGNKFYVLRADQLKGFSQFLRGAMFDGSEKELADYLLKTQAPSLSVSRTPKVWIAAGNCLYGNAAHSANSMVVTTLSAGGAKQVLGYTVPSWYGKGGWGTLNILFDNAVGTTLTEAFFFNNQAILAETQERFPKLMSIEFNEEQLFSGDPEKKKSLEVFFRQLSSTGYPHDKDVLGLVHDRDVVAFFGEPLYAAWLDTKTPNPSPWSCARTFSFNDKGEGLLEITAMKDHEGKFFFWLPQRVDAQFFIELGGVSRSFSSEGVVTNDFLMLRKLALKKGEKATIKMVLPVKK